MKSLTKGALDKVLNRGEKVPRLILKVMSFSRIFALNRHDEVGYVITVTDGIKVSSSVIASTFINDKVTYNILSNHCVINITDYKVLEKKNGLGKKSYFIIIKRMRVVSKEPKKNVEMVLKQSDECKEVHCRHQFIPLKSKNETVSSIPVFKKIPPEFASKIKQKTSSHQNDCNNTYSTPLSSLTKVDGFKNSTRTKFCFFGWFLMIGISTILIFLYYKFFLVSHRPKFFDYQYYV